MWITVVLYHIIKKSLIFLNMSFPVQVFGFLFVVFKTVFCSMDHRVAMNKIPSTHWLDMK
jgi:hypothetical protein